MRRSPRIKRPVRMLRFLSVEPAVFFPFSPVEAHVTRVSSAVTFRHCVSSRRADGHSGTSAPAGHPSRAEPVASSAPSAIGAEWGTRRLDARPCRKTSWVKRCGCFPDGQKGLALFCRMQNIATYTWLCPNVADSQSGSIRSDL